MKTDKNFKMPNDFKNLLGGIKDPKQRSLWKKSFIEAALALGEYRKTKFKPKGE